MIPEQEIARMVKKFHAIHKSVLAMYISRLFNISGHQAENAIHRAIRNRYCVEKEGYICESEFIKPDSRNHQMSRAIRVAMEFMGLEEPDFFERRVLPAGDCRNLLYVILPPTEEALKKNAAAQTRLIQISYIMRGSERASSMLEASVAVHPDFRRTIQRIAIVETGFREDCMVKAGYAMFIRFGKDSYTFNSSDVFSTDEETRWADVPEKE